MKKTRISRWIKKLKAIEYLGGGCKKCGNKNIFMLCFHHKIESEKEFKMSRLLEYSWVKFKTELDKCDLLCLNCHVELHEENKYDKGMTRSLRNKKLLLEFVEKSECEKCGYNKCNRALEFHHLEDKEFHLGDINLVLRNIEDLNEQIISEVNKCKILCKNCHIYEHADIEEFQKFKKELYLKTKNYKPIQGKIDRKKVYEMYDKGMKQIEIAKFFKASKGTISDILKPYKKDKR